MSFSVFDVNTFLGKLLCTLDTGNHNYNYTGFFKLWKQKVSSYFRIKKGNTTLNSQRPLDEFILIIVWSSFTFYKHNTRGI